MMRVRDSLTHRVYVTKRKDFSYKEWCEEHFGPKFDVLENKDGVWTIVWAGPYRARQDEFRFKNEADAMMFTLKWL